MMTILYDCLATYTHMYVALCMYVYIYDSENGGSGQQCCYSENGMLIVGPEAGGTVDRYAPEQHFWKHQLYDVLPYIFCCKGLFSDCSAYYNKRPSDNGNGYNLNPPGMYHFMYVITYIRR